MSEIGIPFLYILGNSDLRNKKTSESIKKKASVCKNAFNETMIFAVNDCDMKISEEQFSIIEEADENSIVFMHHRIGSHVEGDCYKLLKWRKTHGNTMLFHGHLHRSYADSDVVSLQAIDPDKAIGENPCITYYDTRTKKCRKAYFFSPVPNDIYNYFGVSCYKSIEQIEFAIKKGLKHIELRPNCVNADIKTLSHYIEQWRNVGGECLSVHLPDVEWFDDTIKENKNFKKLIEIIKILKADRVTQHVPVVSVKEVNKKPIILEKISEYIADKLNQITHNLVIGIENMHMTAKDMPDDNRRLGYIPEECIEFMQMFQTKSRHKVGINFDIGHARNNAPYSQKYQISTWLSMVGKHIVGYHIHQVNYENGIYENHMPITDIYGFLISYASFFKYWTTEKVNKVPVIFEMRPEGAYETKLKTFDHQRRKNVFDIHSHTYYSDNPDDLINTAIQNGIRLFGICDHNYGIGERKREYYNEMCLLKEQYKDKIKLLCGIEIATYPHLFDIDDVGIIKDFEYCLIEHITEPNSIVKDNLFEFCENLGILCGIAHTDLFKYCDMYGYDYNEFFSKMAENNIFWEMNVSYDSIHKYNEHQYVLDFMNDIGKQNIVKKSGIYISIGFDSHRCEDYDGFKVHEMYDFLK